MNTLPTGWEYVNLGDLVQPSKERFNPVDNENRLFIGLEHIESGTGKIIGKGNSVDTRSLKSVFSSGDILYGRLRPYLNKVVVPEFNGVCSTDILVFKKNELFSFKYLALFILTPPFVQYATQNMSGVQHPRVKFETLAEFSIPVAPFNEQVRIVGRVEELFSWLDAGVRSLQATQTQLEQYLQTILKQAYTGKLTEKWRQKNEIHFDFSKQELDIDPYNNLITGEIPSEWKWVSLGILIKSMQNGIYKPKKFYSDDGMACLRMYNIEDGKIVWKDIKRMILTEDEIKKFLLKPEDVLINRVNSRELVGKSAVIPLNIEPSVYESKNIRMRLKTDIVLSYYVQYWMYFFSSRYFNLNAQQVVGMASINQTQISNMPIPLTTIEEQKKIVEYINESNSYIERIQNTIEKNLLLKNHLKNSVLKKAFEGCLVPQDPNDEPANFLLERIRTQTVKQRKLI